MAFKGDLEAFVLAVLEESPMHGYEISKEIRRRSEDVLKFGEGQLYPALHRLEEEGMIQAEWIAQAGKPDRKVYQISPTGLAELEKQKGLWRRFAESVSNVLGAKASEVKG